MNNWMLIMKRTKKVTFFTAGFAQVSSVFPFVVGAPAYFAGTMQLGGLMQTASAFSSVQGALSYFVSSQVYRQLAEWLAVIDRLDGFDHTLAAGRAAAVTPPLVKVQPSPDGQAVELAGLEVTLPGGRPLVGVDHAVLRKGEAVLVSGPSGSGKSTMFRAIAGIWPFGSGTVTVPKDARPMTLPQRPYFPVGTLAAAIAYPAEPTAFSRETLKATLEAVGLGALAPRLDEEAHWNRMLSLGEQQRLGIARAILDKPDFLFLDEATASLDEPSEARLYRLLAERLPNTAIVSIGHRSTLAAFHQRRFALEPDERHYRVREAAIESATK
jgi:putative ATP-binding cassette transporter